MAKLYNSISFIRYIYSAKLLDKFKTVSKSMLTKSGVYASANVLFGFSKNAMSTYCRLASRYSSSTIPVFKIFFGGSLVKEVVGLPINTTNRKLLKSSVPDIKTALCGLFFHEVGHLLYTDMCDDSINTYKDKEYISFIHNMMNIFEDVYLEKFGLRRDYVVTQKYFKFLTDRMFAPQALSYTDDGSASSFLNYILLKLRCPKILTAHNAVFDSVAKDLVPMISDILHDDNGTSRIKKTIALCEWLIANTTLDFKHMIKEDELPDYPVPYPPTTPGKAKTGATGGGSSSGGSDPTNRGCTRAGGDFDSGDSDPIPEEPPVFSNVDELEQSLTDEEIVSTYNSENDIHLDELQDIDDAFNSVLSLDMLGNHETIIAKKFFAFGDNLKIAIDEALADVNPISLKVIKSLKLFKGQIRPRDTAGFRSGKLNIPSAIKSLNTGLPTPYLFQKKVARGQAADLAVFILCDNSGSMSGNKSHVCTRAMLALAQACENVGIPIEVCCFTEGSGINYTIVMKAFEEHFGDAKYYFGITDSDICYHYIYDQNIPVFCGNEDEVNLYYCWKKFLKNPHKDKLMFVISDGETCGSSEDLRNLVAQIKESGIKIIGLGIQSRAVATLYPEHKLFDTEESLEGLPDYLLDTLNSLIKKS